MKKIVFWGATGQAIVLEEFINDLGYELIALFDNNPNVNSPFENIPIFYQKEGFKNWKKNNSFKEIFFIVAIGGGEGKSRTSIHDFLKNENLIPTKLIHPKANIARNVEIGDGCQVLLNSTLSARVKLKNNVIVNTSASIDHECIINDGVHIGPGACLAGNIKVGNNSFIGTNATILPNLNIGKNVTIGAGSVVTKNIPDNIIVYGNPAKIVKNIIP